jgi:hypothetical protein
MGTYRQRKVILSPIYLKRVIFNDGIHTRPLLPEEYEIRLEKSLNESQESEEDEE